MFLFRTGVLYREENPNHNQFVTATVAPLGGWVA